MTEFHFQSSLSDILPFPYDKPNEVKNQNHSKSLLSFVYFWYNLCEHRLQLRLLTLSTSDYILTLCYWPLSVWERKSFQNPLQLFLTNPQHMFWVYQTCVLASPSVCSISPPDGDELASSSILFSDVSIGNNQTALKSHRELLPFNFRFLFHLEHGVFCLPVACTKCKKHHWGWNQGHHFTPFQMFQLLPKISPN